MNVTQAAGQKGEMERRYNISVYMMQLVIIEKHVKCVMNNKGLQKPLIFKKYLSVYFWQNFYIENVISGTTGDAVRQRDVIKNWFITVARLPSNKRSSKVVCVNASLPNSGDRKSDFKIPETSENQTFWSCGFQIVLV